MLECGHKRRDVSAGYSNIVEIVEDQIEEGSSGLYIVILLYTIRDSSAAS